MARDDASVNMLVAEYESLFADLRDDSDVSTAVHDDKLVSVLVKDGDWTADGAIAIVELSRNYGSFMLRNALALSLALGIEDGELGH